MVLRVLLLTPERHTESAHEELRDEAKALLKTVLDKNDEEFGRKVSSLNRLQLTADIRHCRDRRRASPGHDPQDDCALPPRL